MINVNKCIDCRKLVGIGCDGKAACYCTSFEQVISRPAITGCSRFEEKEDDI